MHAAEANLRALDEHVVSGEEKEQLSLLQAMLVADVKGTSGNNTV